MIRVPYHIYESREEAIAAGWPNAEFGNWRIRPGTPECRVGWIALDYPSLDTDYPEEEGDYR